MRTVLQRWETGAPASPEIMERVRADSASRDDRRSIARAVGGGVAVIPVYGILTPKGNMLDDISGPGSTSTRMISNAVREAAADDSVGAIALDFDTPGGSVEGTKELADEIYAARAQKPVIAIANHLAASAGFWLASQCNEVYGTPTSEVGSIGVIACHEDVSAMNEQMGVKVTYLTAGANKGEMSPDQPLSDKARAYQQTLIDDFYSMFVSDVARGRGVQPGTVKSAAWGQGRCLIAAAADSVGMIDGVKTFNEAIGRAQQLAKQPRGAARARSISAEAREQQHKLLYRIAQQATQEVADFLSQDVDDA